MSLHFLNSPKRQYFTKRPCIFARCVLCLRMDWKKYPSFTPQEFDSPDRLGSGEMMQEAFIARLQEARKLACTPFKITSGYRTLEHNKSVGGVNSSSHRFGCAADIAISSSHERFLILTGLIRAGFTRIGIADNFIHVDSDETKPENVIWTY